MVACDQCHDMNSFTPSTYTLEDLQQTSFRLEGAHLATPCFMCHATVQDKKWQFADLGNECFNCHDDIHRGQIDTIYYPGSNCLKCHRVSQWSDIGFEHDLTGYKLEGAHSRQGCRDCHFIDDEQGNFKQQFNTINSACLNCHKDIHYAQFEEYGEKSCLRCHGYEKWLVSGFNHDNTNFRLDGKHSGLQCLQCHKQEKNEDLVYILYKIENYRCEDCH